MKNLNRFPEKGFSEILLEEMLPAFMSEDTNWEEGKIFGFVYHPGMDAAGIMQKYLLAYLYDSTMNPATFPSVLDFEKDIITMSAELMHGSRNVSGSLTTGGTESIFLALKVARDLAMEKRTGDTGFEVVLPETIHPAFLKACHLLSLVPVMVKVRDDKRADPEMIRESISKKTILLAASAPCFPYGVIDPVGEIGKIAREHRLPFHVDACMGGFLLPFLEDLGYPVPHFDFRVPGVSSISLDAHKYAYAPKGCSIVLYRNRWYWKKQFFINSDWKGGIFASTTFMGTKSGGPAAGCWAVMKYLGKEGYRNIASDVMKTTSRIKEGLKFFSSLRIISDPDMSVFAFTSLNGDIFSIGDALEARGWHLHRLQFPEALQLTITRLNVGKEDLFLKDMETILNDRKALGKSSRSLNQSVSFVNWLSAILPDTLLDRLSKRAGKLILEKTDRDQSQRSAIYGISASFRNRKNVKKLLESLLEGMYGPDWA